MTTSSDATGSDVLDAAASMRIVRGDPDEAELAALVAGVVAVASASAMEDEDAGPSSAWMDRIRTMRGRRVIGPLGRGPSAWRHSFR